MEELLKLIEQDATPNNGVYQSGVVKTDPQKFEVYRVKENILVPWMSLGEFRKNLRNNPPLLNDFLMIKKDDNEILFCNLANQEINDVIKKDQKLFPILDRVIQYMLRNKNVEIFFNEDGVFSKKQGKSYSSDSNLSYLNTDDVITSLVYKAVEYSGENISLTKNLKNVDLDLMVEVQGVQTRIVFWDDAVNTREFSIKLEPPLNSKFKNKVKPLFEQESGFLLVSSGLLGNLSELLEKNKYQRIAYRGVGSNINLDPKAFCSYFEDKVSIRSLRKKDFDIYVIGLEYLNNIKELYALPASKLCILVVDYPDISKCLSFVKTLCGSDTAVMNYFLENLTAIVADEFEEDPCLVIDSWSREMIAKAEDVDIALRRLKNQFIIRDGVTPAEIVNVGHEVELMLRKADLIGASNIDICPGSPIRLYKTKLQYDSYSSIKMTPILIEMMLMNMISPTEMAKLLEIGELDTSYSLKGVGRYRLGIVKQRSSIAISIRRVPTSVPSPKDLNLPQDFVENAIQDTKGFTMIVGEPNSGKTLTFNCIINEANEKVGGIIFLMGSPIEYTHQHKKALVLQVEIGKDLESYTQGIAKSLRMNTSTLGFEELRTKAEFAALGALINSPNSIFMTMHGPSCRKAVENLVDRLAETGISVTKAQEDVANAINYIIFQKLIEYKGKRILIYEKMRATKTIKNLIRQGNYNQIENAMAAEPECETLDRVILDRLDRKMLDFEAVKGYVRDRGLFESKGYKF